jgi:ribosomal protein L20
MEGLTAAGITLDRKVLADMVVTDEAAFKVILDTVVKALKDKTGKAEKAAA